MSSLVTFRFDNNEIRVVTINHEPWFVLADVLLGMGSTTRPTDAKTSLIQELGDDVVSNYPIRDSLGREQIVLIISESALTFLVSRSRTEVGKKMNRWVHKEVLPAIRKTGVYGIENLSRYEILKMALASEEEKLKLAEANLALTGKNAILESHNNTLKEEVVHLEEVVEHQEPYARLGAGLAHIDENDLDIGTFAKVHTDIGPKNIFITLREIGFLIPKSNLPYQEHIKTKRAKIIRVPRDKQSSIVVEKTLLTPKGQKYIMKKLYELEQKKLVSNNYYMLSEDDF